VMAQDEGQAWGEFGREGGLRRTVEMVGGFVAQQ
jgi:hypothetical protein